LYYVTYRTVSTQDRRAVGLYFCCGVPKAAYYPVIFDALLQQYNLMQ